MPLKCLIISVIFTASALAQQCAIGAPPSGTACSKIMAYDGSNNLLYMCQARSLQKTSTRLSISAGSNANPVSLTSTAHGFNTNQLPLVTISGGTGNWTAVNGTWTATITGANTFTIPVDSTAFGAVAGTLVLDTNAPLTTQAVWSVVKMVYSGTNMVNMFFIGGSPAERNTCSGAPAQYQ